MSMFLAKWCKIRAIFDGILGLFEYVDLLGWSNFLTIYPIARASFTPLWTADITMSRNVLVLLEMGSG